MIAPLTKAGRTVIVITALAIVSTVSAIDQQLKNWLKN